MTSPRTNTGFDMLGRGNRALFAVGAFLLIVASLVGIRDVIQPESADAAPTPTCGASGTPAIVAQHGPHMYIDSGVGIYSSYVAYTIRAGLSSRTGMWISIGNFTGGVVGLASGEAASQLVPTLASGASDTRYFFLTASGATATPQSHTLTLYQGPPDSGVAVCTLTSTIATVAETIKALANKVDSIVTDVPSGDAKIGDAVTVTVQGRTGVLGAGPDNDPGVLSITPSALSNFPAAAWRLEHTQITISPNGADPAVTITDRLYLPGSSGTDRNYTAQYVFRAVGETATPAAVKPIQYIASGTQVKHTDPGAIAVGSLPPVSGTAELSIAKTGNKTLATRVSPLTTAERTIAYTVTITNTGDGSGTLDKLVDTIPSGSTFVTGTATVGGRSVSNTSYNAATRELTWPGPLRIPAFGTLVITYSLVVADAVALHTNSVVGEFGNVQIDSTASVADNAPASHTFEIRDATGSVSAVADTASTSANSTVTVSVLTNDSTTRPGGTLTVESAGVDNPPDHGVVAVSGASTVDYTPDGGFSGTDTFSYRATDGAASASATVTVTVSPKAVADFYSTAAPVKDTAISFTTVLGNDVCGTCTAAKTADAAWDTNIDAANYTVTFNSNGTFSLTPKKVNSPTPVKFAYTLTDTVTGLTSSARVQVTLSSLAPDSATTPYETVVNIDPLANDTTKSGSFTIPSGGSPSHGTYSTSSKNYTPDTGYWGADAFTYKVGSSTQTVNILVGPPTITHQMIPGESVTSTLASANCSACEFTIVTAPTNGTLSIAIGGSYTYASGSSSANTATYKVTNPATGLYINGVINLNVGPRAVDDSEEILLPATASGNVITNDTCPATCTASKLTNPSFGSASVSSNGAWTFNPSGEIGTATFNYQIVSSVAPTVTDTGTVTITVEGAADDAAETNLDTTVNVAVLGNDPCSGCTVTARSTPTSGTATLKIDGTIDYTPAAGFSGEATFTYTVTKSSRTSTATVTVSVLPNALDDSVATTQGATSDIDVLFNDTCAECTITAVTAAGKGTTSIVDGLFVEYVSGVSASGLDSFTYTVTDGFGKTASATVTISIATAPEPVDDVATTNANAAAIIDVRLNDSCANCIIDKISEPSSGSAAVRVDGKMQFVPALDSSGVVTFDYSATDPATGLTGTATVTVTVSPTATDDSARTAIGIAVTVNVRGNDACSSCSVTIDAGPSGSGNGASVVSNSVRFTPASNFSGTDTVSYTVTDPVTNLTANAIVTIRVENAAPDAAATPYTTQVTVSNILANDTCTGCTVSALRNIPSGKGTPTISGSSVLYTPPTGVTGIVTFDYDAEGTSGGAPLAGSSSGSRLAPARSRMRAMAVTTVSSSVTVLVGPPTQTYGVNTFGTKTGDIISNTDPTAVISDTNCPNCITTVVTAPSNGEISLAEDGAWTYTAPGSVQTDTLTYKVTDPVTGQSVNGTITFNVTEIPTPLISISKVAGTINRSVVSPSTRIDEGDTVPFTLTVTNTGNVTLTSISVSDPSLTSLTCGATTLARSTSTTCTGTHTFTQAEIDAGAYINVAEVTASSTAGAPPTSSVAVSTSIPRSSGVALSKSADTAVLPGAGSVIAYTLIATNTGNVTLTDVTITDPGNSVSCPVNLTILPGESLTCTASHTVTQAEVDAGAYTNEASVSSTAPSGVSNPSATASVTLRPTAPATVSVDSVGGTPDLTLAAPITRLDANDTIPITTTITNTSIYTLSNFQLTDARLSTLCTPALNTSLAPGASIVCTGNWTVTQTALNSGAITDTVSVSATASSGATPSDSTSREITLSRTATLSLEKVADSGSQLPTAGTQVNYTITGTNTGNVTLTNATITDAMLGSLSCTPTNGSTLLPSGTIICQGSHTVTSAEYIAESLTNNASISATAPSGLSNPSATASLTLTQNEPASVSITAVAASPSNGVQAPNDRTDSGDTVALTTTITNDGPRSINSIVLTDAIGTPSCSTPLVGLTLAPGASVTCTGVYTVSQSVLDAGGRTDTVSVSAAAANGDTPTDSDSRVITLSRVATLSLTKTADSGTTLPLNGTVVNYTMRGTNIGNVTLTNVTISDPMLTSLSCTPTNGSTLLPNAVIECTGSHTVTKAEFYAQTLTNTATVMGAAPSGVTNPSDSESLTLTHNRPSSVLITAVAASPTNNLAGPSNRTDEGDSVGLTTTITNDGPYDLTNIGLTDAIGTPVCSTSLTGLTLAPGASVVCTGTYSVVQSALDVGSRTDTVTVNATAGNNTTPSDSDVRTINLGRVPGITIDKTPSVTRLPSAGNAISYTFLVTNSGNVTLSNVSITDPNVASVSCPVGFTGVLTPGATVTCSGSHTVTTAEATAGTLSNTASVSADGPTGTGSVSANDSVTVTADGLIQVGVTSTVVATDDTIAGSPTRTDEGDQVQITTTITNTGEVDLVSLGHTDAYVGTCAWDLTIGLVAGDSITCTWWLDLSQGMIDAGTVSTSVQVVGTTSSGRNANASTTRSFSIVQVPEINLVKVTTDTELPAVGGVISYAITITNDGNVTLSDVAVVDPSVTDLECTPSLLALSFAPGDSIECTASHTVTQADIDAGGYSNTATVSADPPSNITFSDHDTVDLLSNASSSISVSSVYSSLDESAAGIPGRTDEGDTIDAETTITNSGALTLENIAVVDSEIAGMCDTELFGLTLAPGEQVTCTENLTITQQQIDDGTLASATVSVSADTLGGTSVDDSDNRAGAISQVVDLAIDKSTTSTHLPSVNDDASYVIQVTNSGNVTLHDLAVTDPSVSDLVCLPATTVVILSPGDTIDCTATHTVTQADVDAEEWTNTASVEGFTPAAVQLNESDGVTLAGTESASVAITSIFGSLDNSVAGASGRTDAGDTVEVTTTITNTGGLTLINLASTDSELTGFCSAELVGISMAPGDEITCTQTITITQVDLDAGLMPSADVDVSGESISGTPTSSSTTRSYTLVRVRGLTFTKTALTASYSELGDALDYELVAKNTGNVTLTSAAIIDADVGTLSCSATTTLNPDNGDETNDDEWLECTGTHFATTDDVAEGSFTNVAQASANPPTGMTPLNRTDSATVNALVTAAIEISSQVTLEDDEQVSPSTRPDAGDTRTILDTITNTGITDLTSLGLDDELFPGNCETSLAGVVLAPGEFFNCEVVHEISQEQIDDAGILTIVSAAGTSTSGASVAASTTRSIPLARTKSTRLSVSVSLDETCPGPLKNVTVDPEEIVTVCFVITNTGNGTIRSVQILTSTGDSPELTDGTFPLLPKSSATFSMKRPFSVATKVIGYASDVSRVNPFPTVSDSARVNINRPVVDPTSTTTTLPGPGNTTALTGTNSRESSNFGLLLIVMGTGLLLLSRLNRRRHV